MAKKFFTDESLTTFVDETKSYVNDAISNVAYIDIEDDSVDVEDGSILAEINDRVNNLQQEIVDLKSSGIVIVQDGNTLTIGGAE